MSPPKIAQTSAAWQPVRNFETELSEVTNVSTVVVSLMGTLVAFLGCSYLTLSSWGGRVILFPDSVILLQTMRGTKVW